MADENAFVTALMEDNARLRREIDDRASAAISAATVADTRERRLMWVMFNMLHKLGGKFEMPRDTGWLISTDRMFIERDYDRIVGLRLTSEGEYAPEGALVTPEAA